ncbi:MAG: AAA family ATPase [Victivallales bacterium]|nr:AAA family ATPase [Victivallales bacterium]
MKIDLETFRETLRFSELEWAFGEMVSRRSGMTGDDAAALELLAATALHVTETSEENHSCLNLEEWLKERQELKNAASRHAEQLGRLAGQKAHGDQDIEPEVAENAHDYAESIPSWPTLAEWQEAMERRWKTAVATEEADGSAGAGQEPLVWVPARRMLYLRKFRQAERTIAELVKKAVAAPHATPVPIDKIRAITKRFESPAAAEQVNAVQTAFQRRLAIVTGGPGTGKTTTLAAILAMELAANPELRVALCAPTGKASSQMRTSIAEELEYLQCPNAVKDKLGLLVPVTIHQLLGISLSNGGLPKYHAKYPLPYELVVADECSMVPLLLFGNLVGALPEGGRLLLLGDKDQLDSVESGKVFAELCRQAEVAGIPLQRLRENFRSKENPRLVQFARRLSDGLPDKSEARELTDELFTDGGRIEATGGVCFGAAELPAADDLEKTLDALYRRWVPDAEMPQSAEEALRQISQFKVLCVVNEGPFGVTRLNAVMAKIILKKDGIRLCHYSDGMPVMILQNDPVGRLKNGDVGVCWGGKVWFPHLQ